MLNTDTRTTLLERFRRNAVAGLAGSPKTLPARWLYDDDGSALSEAITQLAEYYPTRTESGSSPRQRQPWPTLSVQAACSSSTGQAQR